MYTPFEEEMMMQFEYAGREAARKLLLQEVTNVFEQVFGDSCEASSCPGSYDLWLNSCEHNVQLSVDADHSMVVQYVDNDQLCVSPFGTATDQHLNLLKARLQDIRRRIKGCSEQ